MSISTKEELKAHIHSIHDYIRNSGAGYSMTAMKIFILFYGLKLIEPLRTKLNISDKCSFKKLVEIANDKNVCHKGSQILSRIINRNNDNDGILAELNDIKDENIKKILFYHIPEDLQDEHYSNIIKLIDEIPTVNNKVKSNIDEKYDVDVKGKIYEYFIGRDKTAISEMGAYYTERHVTNYIINNHIQPKLKHGNVPSFIDPFGGSGGFSLTFVKYLIDNNPNINWTNNINNIFHFDMSDDVLKISGLEMLGLTKVVPNMETNFKRTNSFTDEFDYKGEPMQFKYILSNPPYGGDKTKNNAIIDKLCKLQNELKSRYLESVYDEKKKKNVPTWNNTVIDAKQQYTELNEQLKAINDDLDNKKVNLVTCSKRIQEFCIKHANELFDDSILKSRILWDKLAEKFTDKEACSLILFMELLAKKGICAVVLKQGVFFDSKYASVRKILINNFKVTKVISVPNKEFENTTTATSILIFENTGKTEQIEFYDLIITKEKADIYEVKDRLLHIVKNKDDIINVDHKLITTASYEQISQSTERDKFVYSLNYKKYLDKSNDIKCSDDYELIKLGDIVDYMPKSKRPASYGKDSGKYKFYTSSDKIKYCDTADYTDKDLIIIGNGGVGSIFIDTNFSCSDHNFVFKIQYPKYYYCLLIILRTALFANMNGSTLCNLGKEQLNNFKIPIPKSKDKLKEWVQKLSKPYDKLQEYKETLKELEYNIQEEIKRISNEEECIEHKLGDVAEINNNNITREHNYKYIYYLDIANANKGNINSLQHIELKDAPTRAKRIITENDIVIGTVRPSQEHYAIINKAHYVNNLIASTGYAVITPTKINNYYCYYQITNKQAIDYYVKMSEGSGYPAVGFDVIANYKIKIPKDTNLLDKLDIKFKELEELQELIKKTEVKYNKVLQELKEDCIIKNTDTNIVNEIDTEDKKSNNTSVDNDDVSTEQSKKTKRKSKVK